MVFNGLLITFDIRYIIQWTYLFIRTPVKKLQLIVSSILGHVYSTTSNIGVSIISLHDTPRLHILKRVIRIFFIPRTYNESNKLTLGYIHQNPTRNTKVALLLSNATVIFKISLQNLQNMAAVI